MAEWKQIITEANKVTDLTAPTGAFDMNSQKITSLSNPTAAQHAATKAYVDAAVETDTVRTVTAGGNTLAASETLAFTEGSNITISESGGAVTITAANDNTQLSTSAVQDIVGAMFSSNTETNIAATYENSDGTIDLVATDANVSTVNLKAKLQGPFVDNAVQIGDANDVVTIGHNLVVTGDLQVSGSTITTTTETLEIADNTMILNSDKSGSADVDAGIIVERGTDGDNALFFWDEGADRWKVGTNDNANLTTSPTINADVGLIEITGSFTSNSTAVPIGHLQYHSGNLYVRVED